MSMANHREREHQYNNMASISNDDEHDVQLKRLEYIVRQTRSEKEALLKDYDYTVSRLNDQIKSTKEYSSENKTLRDTIKNKDELLSSMSQKQNSVSDEQLQRDYENVRNERDSIKRDYEQQQSKIRTLSQDLETERKNKAFLLNVLHEQRTRLENQEREMCVIRGNVSNPEITMELQLLEQKLRAAEIIGFKKPDRLRDDASPRGRRRSRSPERRRDHRDRSRTPDRRDRSSDRRGRSRDRSPDRRDRSPDRRDRGGAPQADERGNNAASKDADKSSGDKGGGGGRDWQSDPQPFSSSNNDKAPFDSQNNEAVECFNCHEVGHFRNECPKKDEPRKCFKCGQTDHLASECPAEDAEPTMTYEVPGNKVGAIIGPKGATIRQIRDETNCNIEIPPRDFSQETVEVKIISFAASKADAMKVVEMIKKIVSGIPLISPDDIIAKCMVPADKIGRIIGAGGSNINQIRDDTDCEVMLPSKDRDPSIEFCEVIVKSRNRSKKDCDKAIEMIKNSVEGNYDKTCHNCQQTGHFAADCPQDGAAAGGDSWGSKKDSWAGTGGGDGGGGSGGWGSKPQHGGGGWGSSSKPDENTAGDSWGAKKDDGGRGGGRDDRDDRGRGRDDRDRDRGRDYDDRGRDREYRRDDDRYRARSPERRRGGYDDRESRSSRW